MNTRANYAPDMAWEPHDRHQRQSLARLARRAWDKHLAWHNSTAFDTWRREQSIRSCGRRITEATQRDYLGLKAHFLDLLGESGQALNTLLRAESEPARIAAFKLNRLLVGLRLNRAYAEKICFCKFGCSLAEASASQIWKVFFTVKNRRKTAAPAARQP